MIFEKYKMRVIVTACSFALLSVGSLVSAQSMDSSHPDSQQSGKAQANAMLHISDAAALVKRMENEPGMNNLLQQAQGIFIVSEYGRAALGVGTSGGAGVLLAKNNGAWGNPVFYSIGSVSIGVQGGAEGGPIALVLTNDKAVNSFKQKNNFSLSADAGLTVVDWSKVAQGNVGGGDIVAWSATKGLFGNAAIGVQEIRFNQDETSAYYNRNVAATDVISGNVENPHADILKQALAETSSKATSGSSGSMSGSASGGRQGGGASDAQSSGRSSSSPSGATDGNK